MRLLNRLKKHLHPSEPVPPIPEYPFRTSYTNPFASILWLVQASLPQPVVDLAEIIRLVNRFPFLTGKPVLPFPSDLFIACLHGFPTGSAVDNAMEQVVEGAGVPLHNRRRRRSISSCTFSQSSGLTMASWQSSMTSQSFAGDGVHSAGAIPFWCVRKPDVRPYKKDSAGYG